MGIWEMDFCMEHGMNVVLISSPGHGQSVSLSILTPSGRVIVQKSIELKEQKAEVSLSQFSLSDGFYIAKIQCGSVVNAQRFYFQQ